RPQPKYLADVGSGGQNKVAEGNQPGRFFLAGLREQRNLPVRREFIDSDVIIRRKQQSSVRDQQVKNIFPRRIPERFDGAVGPNPVQGAAGSPTLSPARDSAGDNRLRPLDDDLGCRAPGTLRVLLPSTVSGSS